MKCIKKNEVRCMTYLPANSDLLTPRNRVVLEMLKVVLPVKKLSALYGTQKSIILFTTARHPSLCGTRRIHSILSQPRSLRSILRIPNPMSISHPSNRSYVTFRNMLCFFTVRGCLIQRKSQAEGHPFSTVLDR